MAVQIQVRRGTAAQWANTNPNLAAGEIGFETDSNKFKIGTGVVQTIGTSDTNSFKIKTNNTDRVTIASGGDVTLANNLTVSGTSTLTGNVTNAGILSSSAATRTHTTSLGGEYLTKTQILLLNSNNQYYRTIVGHHTVNESRYLGKGLAVGGDIMLANGIPYWFHGNNGVENGARYVYLHIPANAVVYRVGHIANGFTPSSTLTNLVPLTVGNTYSIPTDVNTSDTTTNNILLNTAPTHFPVSASAQDVLIATTTANDTWAFGFVRVK